MRWIVVTGGEHRRASAASSGSLIANVAMRSRSDGVLRAGREGGPADHVGPADVPPTSFSSAPPNVSVAVGRERVLRPGNSMFPQRLLPPIHDKRKIHSTSLVPPQRLRIQRSGSARRSCI